MIYGVLCEATIYQVCDLNKEKNSPDKMSFFVEAKAPRPKSPSCDEETILSELPRYLAARPPGLVETSGLEPLTPCMSSKYSNQLSYASKIQLRTLYHRI